MQKDNPNMPVGYARAMVELYLMKPELFSKDNIDNWSKTRVPPMEVNNGSMSVLTPDEASAFEARVSALEEDSNNFCDVTNGDDIELQRGTPE
jgi:hypothetical protein